MLKQILDIILIHLCVYEIKLEIFQKKISLQSDLSWQIQLIFLEG